MTFGKAFTHNLAAEPLTVNEIYNVTKSNITFTGNVTAIKIFTIFFISNLLKSLFLYFLFIPLDSPISIAPHIVIKAKFIIVKP